MERKPYDFGLERERCRDAFPDVERGGVRLNRGLAAPELAGGDPEGFAETRARHRAVVVTSTLAEDAPVIELDRPVTGIYVGSRRGVYLDLHCAVAQRLFDDARLAPRLAPLVSSGLLLRREINTDDYLGFAPPGIRLPQDLAGLVAGEVHRLFPRSAGYRVFFSNSGTEAVEAAVKAAARFAYHRFVQRRGQEGWAAVCRALGIPPLAYPEAPAAGAWADYPLFFVAVEGAFHGRTLGSLALTKSRPVQREAFPSWRWVLHLPRSDPRAVEAAVDPRPLEDLEREAGGLAGLVRAGRIPGELLAGMIYEPFQGEGGYRLLPRDLLEAMRRVCDRHGALLIADEVQTFARAGETLMSARRAIRPDVVCVAKAAVLGMTVLPVEVAEVLPAGWHSNTFGSGKLFDVNYAHAVLDTFLHERDPLFQGRSFAENERLKGECLAERLDDLCRRYPEIIRDPQGMGCMWGLTIRDRSAFIREAWRQGAKLLGAGGASAPGRIRIILPADVLAKETDDVVRVLDRTCAALEAGRA